LITQRALSVSRDHPGAGVTLRGQLPDGEDGAGIANEEIETVFAVTAAAERRGGRLDGLGERRREAFG
jgi:hypothetical protein